jgi:hypothetical protein
MNKKQFKQTPLEKSILLADKAEPVWSIPNILRDIKSEQRVWREQIQRIVDRHDLRDSDGDKFKYKFYTKPKGFNDTDMYLVGRAVVQEVCYDHLYPGDFCKEVLGPLHNGETEILLESNSVKIKENFRRFLENLLYEGVGVQGEKILLPHFLEWLKGETIYNPNPKATEKIPEDKNFDRENINSSQKKLIEKYVKIATNFCQSFKDRGEQYPSKSEVEKYLLKCLKKAGEKLGKFKPLPERKLREIWEKVPNILKREIGVTTKKRK